jgi:hypothetical protein
MPTVGNEFGGGLDSASWIIEEVEHLVYDGDIKFRSGHRRCEDVGLSQFGVVDTGSIEVRASDAQHGGAGVESDEPISQGSKKLDHPSCAGSDVENVADPATIGGQQEDDGGLHQLVGGVKGPLSVPPLGDLSEVMVRDFRSPFTHC